MALLLTASLIGLFILNGFIFLGIRRERLLLTYERTAKKEDYNSLFRFRNWRDR